MDKDGRVNGIDYESAVICEGDTDVGAGEQDKVEEACKRVKASGNIADSKLSTTIWEIFGCIW